MLFDQFPNTVPEQYRDAAREWLTNEFNQSILTGSEVCAFCGITQSKLSRIVATENPFFVFKKGNVFLFIAHYAYPWMEDVKAQQAASVAARQTKSDKKKVGRPKKVKGEYTYTLFGTEYKSTAPIAEEHNNWLGYIASQWPDYFEGGKYEKVYGHMIMSQPEALRAQLKEVNALFRKMAAGLVS